MIDAILYIYNFYIYNIMCVYVQVCMKLKRSIYVCV